MTISATYSPAQASGNGATVAFPFTFKTFAETDLVVIITDANDVDTTQTITTHYTVSLNADQNNNPGGTVTMLTAPATGETLTIARQIDALQETDIANGGGFYPEVLEDALDRLTMLSQQNADDIDRSLTLPVTVAGVSTELPVPEALSIIGWNADGTALVNYGAESLTGTIASIDWVTDIFDGDNATTIFALSRDPGVASNCDVAISGVVQTPGVDFTVTTTSIVFTAAPPTGTGNVIVRFGSALPAAATVPTDGVATASIQDLAVTTGKIADDAVTAAKIADAELKALAGLTSAANKVPMFSGSGTATLLDFKDEDNMASDSATAVPSQQSVKAYVDALTTGEITLGTPVASTSGTAIDFTGIPAGTKRITINFVGVSTNGSSNLLVQLGDSGGIETTGYNSGVLATGPGRTDSTAGFIVTGGNGAAHVWRGAITLNLEKASSFTWTQTGSLMEAAASNYGLSAGAKSLSAELTQVRITAVNGTDAFDAGEINISYEG